MTTKTQQPEPPPKLRDAERSKRALLQAGTELFAEKGYSRARLRDIAGRAGVDAALVIRYFGSKHGLYQATLDNDDSSGLPLARRLTGNSLSELVDELVEHALTRWEDTGVGPLALSLSRPDAGTDIRAEVHQRVGDAILEPLSTAAAAAGLPEPRLRAEIAVATLVGIGTIRSLGSLEALSATDRATLEPLLRVAVASAFRP